MNRATEPPAAGAAGSPSSDPAGQSGKGDILVRSQLHESVMPIRMSSLELIVTFGVTGGQDVLVPLLDWQVLGVDLAETEGADPENPVGNSDSRLIPLENAAFLMFNMSVDLREAIRKLAMQSKGGIAPLEDRMTYTSELLRNASIQLGMAADIVDTQILDIPEANRMPSGN